MNTALNTFTVFEPDLAVQPDASFVARVGGGGKKNKTKRAELVPVSTSLLLPENHKQDPVSEWMQAQIWLVIKMGLIEEMEKWLAIRNGESWGGLPDETGSRKENRKK